MTYELEERVNIIETDLIGFRASFQRWSADHNQLHNNADARLNMLLEELQSHNHNHHSRASTIKQSGWVALMVTTAAVFAELAGLLDLVRQLPLPFL